VFSNTFGLFFSFRIYVYSILELENPTSKIRSNSKSKSSISRFLVVGLDIALSSSFILELYLFTEYRDRLSSYICTTIRYINASRVL
jgi:hypothetical protein